MQEKEKEFESRIIHPCTESGKQIIVHVMSQVTLKELELVWLKNQNKNIESMALKREQERKTWEGIYVVNKCWTTHIKWSYAYF